MYVQIILYLASCRYDKRLRVDLDLLALDTP